MAEPPTHPGKVEWSGENPGMYLKMEEDGPFACLVSFFRVVCSPHGPGHSLVILTEPAQSGERPGQVNACYTDNPDLARYLNREFLAHFAAFKGNPNLGGLPVRRAISFAHSGRAVMISITVCRSAGSSVSSSGVTNSRASFPPSIWSSAINAPRRTAGLGSRSARTSPSRSPISISA